MFEITNAPLEGTVVEVTCFQHSDKDDCRGELHRAIVDPYAQEIDGVCDKGLDERYLAI